MDRRAERLEEERPMLEQAVPSVELDIENGLVLVHDWALPEGWSHETTDVLVEVPVKYPSTPPDNVCVRSDLTLVSGGTPQNSQGVRRISNCNWQQFSYHIEPADWRPNRNLQCSTTLVDYLHGAMSRFEDAS
jgi:hypothetical protein